MFLAYDYRTGELIGQVATSASQGETVVVLTAKGYAAMGADSVRVEKVK